MEFNREFAEEKLTSISLALGEVSPSPDAAIQAIARLNLKAGLPIKLSEVNVPESGILKMARNAMDDWCHLNNPRPCSESDMVTIFNKAI